VLGENDEIWAERAQFAATLVRERWPEPFDPRHPSPTSAWIRKDTATTIFGAIAFGFRGRPRIGMITLP
jgi:hypothetical protein